MASPPPVLTPDPGLNTPSLYQYMLQTQRFLADTSETYVNPEDLTDYINRARREVAMRTQSIRILTPVSGQISSITVNNPGSGYTNPTVIITPPDSPSGAQPNPGGLQAQATALVTGGQISGIDLTDPGDGYFQPHVYFDDPTGIGAIAQALTTPLTATRGQQEIYPFSSAPLTSFPGVAEIFAVKSISFIYMNYRYSIPVFPFSIYQAYVRIYPQQYLYVPTAAAQFGQGTNGSLYMYPIPATLYQMEWDSFCLPIDLIDDTTFEAIPKPWTDAVPYFAAHLAFLELQNLNAAKFYLDLYDNMVHRYSAYARPGRAINPYGRWSAFT
jgi:hypothetical protein